MLTITKAHRLIWTLKVLNSQMVTSSAGQEKREVDFDFHVSFHPRGLRVSRGLYRRCQCKEREGV